MSQTSIFSFAFVAFYDKASTKNKEINAYCAQHQGKRNIVMLLYHKQEESHEGMGRQKLN